MVVCFIALAVFAVLGIFSATHRELAKEAFDCVLKKTTLRPCNTGFDSKIKKMVFNSLNNKHEKTAYFVFKHFESISFLFTILLIVSLVFTGIGAYNYWAYGNCNGPDSSEFCVYNIATPLTTCDSNTCVGEDCTCEPGAENCNLDSNYAVCDSNCS